MIISLSDFLYSSFSVKSLSDCLVCLNELIQFFCELFILMSDDSDVIIKGINFNLKIGVIVKKSWVAISCTFELFSHVHNLILLGSYLSLEFFYLIGQFNVSHTLRINSLLKVCVFISIFVFQTLQMIKFILKANDLIFKLDYFLFAIH